MNSNHQVRNNYKYRVYKILQIKIPYLFHAMMRRIDFGGWDTIFQSFTSNLYIYTLLTTNEFEEFSRTSS